MLALTSNATSNGWLEFRQDKDAEAVKPDNFFDRFGKTLGLGEGYQMKLTQDETDFRQIRHQRYQLFYKNVRVEGVEYGLHSHTGQLVTAHGRIVENLLIDVDKPIAERQALEVALTEQKVPVEAYKAQELPKGELLIARLGEEVVRENFQLCYAFEVRTDRLAARKEGYEEPKRIYVDATTGKVVKQIELIQKCFHAPAEAPKTQPAALLPLAGQNNQNAVSFAPLTQSTFIPRWNNYLNGQGSLTFETEQFGSQYRLSHQNGALLTRRDVNQTGHWDSNPEVLNNGTNWGTNNQNATTAHWLTQRVYQFYQQFSQDQNGINRQGTYPHILVDYNPTGTPDAIKVNAAWDNIDQIVFGFAPIGACCLVPDYNRTLVTADILGHEYTHAITQNNANLAYQGESGALNESISDIFGTAFERYLFPNNWNYDLGSDSYLFRSMANPTQAHPPVQLAQPQIYQGPNWFPISGNCDRNNDFCGVHENSGVFNKWFHTLCEGQGPNGQMTPKINFDDATKIVYRALRYYLQSYSGYYDAVYATNNAAGDLFFRCSPQDRAARAAWRAVGIEPGNCPISCDYQGVNYTTASVNCNQPLTLSAGCTGGNFATCTGISYSFSGPNAPYNYGSSSLNVTAPANAGTYQYSVSLSRNEGYCFSPTLTFNVNVNCASQNPCDFSSGPRYVGTWSGLDVQIRQISGHNVLVTAIPGSANDKYYPRGDNFWNQFTKDPGAVNLQSCLNAGTSGYYGFSFPDGIYPPSGYYQGNENDGAVFFAQNGSNPPNPCDFSSGPRRLGTWNGYEVQIRNFPNGKRALVAAEAGSYNDKYFPRGDNFWDNFTKDAGAEQYRPCLNAGDTDWYGNAMPSSITPPAGYQIGHVPNDGATYFSTDGLRVAAKEAVLEDVRLVTVRPNPARDEVILTFILKEGADVPVRLLDLQGRVQQRQTFKGVAGKNERVLSVASLPTGLYAIEVMMEGQRIIQKLVKE